MRPLAIVTGANSGFGYGLTELLLAQSVDVIMACRNPALAERAALELGAAVAAASTDGARQLGTATVMPLDLADLRSVCAFAAAFTAAHGTRQLAYLVNNAGIVLLGAPRTVSAQGFELTVAVNHLGHAALLNLLLPILSRCATRVVAVASMAHASATLTVGAPLDAATGMAAYANSKLLNVQWALEVQRRFSPRGITANSGHPGVGLYTGIGGSSTTAHALRYTLIPLLTPLLWITGYSQTWRDGGVAELAACDAPEGGLYFNRATVATASAAALDTAASAWSWNETQRMLRDAAAKFDLNPAIAYAPLSA